MHPRTVELIDHIDRGRQVVRDAVASVPAEKHASTPPSGGWSVLGVLEHLATVEMGIARIVQKLIDDARAAGLVSAADPSPILPTIDTSKVLNRTVKISAPERIHPKGGRDLASLWTALEESRAAMRAAIESSDGLDLRTIEHPHPAFGPMDLYHWFAFVGSHEERHAAQIREIGASVAGAS
jgi:uncharacterized damage-inducible protein DinB